MSNDEMKRTAEVVKEVVKPIAEDLKAVSEKLDATFDQVAELTVKVNVEIIPRLDEHSEILKEHTKILKKLEDKSDKNSEDVKRLNKRLSVTEANQGFSLQSSIR